MVINHLLTGMILQVPVSLLIFHFPPWFEPKENSAPKAGSSEVGSGMKCFPVIWGLFHKPLRGSRIPMKQPGFNGKYNELCFFLRWLNCILIMFVYLKYLLSKKTKAFSFSKNNMFLTELVHTVDGRNPAPVNR